MGVLLIAEVNGGALALDATAKALTAARKLGPVTVLVAGAGVAAAAAEAATLQGVARVLVADDAAYGKGLAEPLAALVAGMQGFGHILAPATASAKNLMPRVAALRDVMVISDVTGVVDADTFERPIYAGNAIQTVRSADAVKVATVRTAGFEATGAGGSAPVEPVAAAGDPGLSAWVEDRVAGSDRPELTSAGMISRSSRSLPTSSARPSAPRARRSIRAMRRTTGRWARPARSWRRSFTSRSASRGRSSTSRG
jgi:electron transfer flavoprotein alpha subunit